MDKANIKTKPKRKPIISWAIIFLCTFIYVGEAYIGLPLYRHLTFLPVGAMNGELVFAKEFLLSEPWRIFTPALLHFSIIHLVLNMLAMFIFGKIIEREDSRTNLIALIFICAIVGNVAQYFMTGPFFGGLSGAIFGLAFYILVRTWKDPFFQGAKLIVKKGVAIEMAIIIAIGFTGLLEGFVKFANYAHLLGAISGSICGFLVASQSTSKILKPGDQGVFKLKNTDENIDIEGIFLCTVNSIENPRSLKQTYIVTVDETIIEKNNKTVKLDKGTGLICNHSSLVAREKEELIGLDKLKKQIAETQEKAS